MDFFNVIITDSKFENFKKMLFSKNTDIMLDILNNNPKDLN